MSAGERFDRLEEYLQVLVPLLSGTGPVSFAGRYYGVRDARCDPPSTQRPHPPLTIGGKGPRRALPIVARWADHWSYPGGTVDEFRAARSALAGSCAVIGRNVDEIEVPAQLQFDGLEGFARQAAEYAGAAVRHLIVRFRTPLSVRDLEAVAERSSRDLDLETSNA